MNKQWAIDLGANCAECPLKHCKAVPPEAASTRTREAIIVAEAPGKSEEVFERPLIGASGSYLVSALKRVAKIQRKQVHLTNALLCRPPRNFSKKQWKKALAACQPRLEKELAGYKGLILALGGKALQALMGTDKIEAWRGYPVKFRPLIFPTYHPAYVLRAPHMHALWEEDLRRAFGFKTGKLKKWKWPSLLIHEGDEMARALEGFHNSDSLGVDIEAAGKSYRADLLCIGIADTEVSVSVPWPPTDGAIEELTRSILRSPIEKVLQNGGFDSMGFEYHGIAFAGPVFDTMDAHSIAYSQMPHNLSLMGSQFFPAPRWKSQFKVFDDRKGGGIFAKAKEDRKKFEALREYNAQDAYMTVLLRHALGNSLDKLPNGWRLYKQTRHLQMVGVKMHRRGISVNTAELDSHAKELQEQVKKLEEALAQIIGEDINPKSTKQLRKYFFGDNELKARLFTPTGEPALDEDSLLDIVSRTEGDVQKAARLILKHRQVVKLLDAYVTPLQEQRSS